MGLLLYYQQLFQEHLIGNQEHQIQITNNYDGIGATAQLYYLRKLNSDGTVLDDFYTTDQKEKLKVRNKSITEDIEKGIDLEKLREEGTPGIDTLYSKSMDPRMRESYERNKGNPEFNKEMEAFRKGKPNLTDDEILERLKKNKGLLQIGQTVYNTGRLALRIGSGLWQLNKLNRGF